jgi:hypothetical protein
MSATILRITQFPLIAYAIREHAALLVLVVAYLASAILVAQGFGIAYDFMPNLMQYLLLIVTPLVLAFCLRTIYVMVFIRPDQLTRYLIASIKPYIEPKRLTYALPILVMIPAFGTAFTFYKSAIPLFHPYNWDVRLSHLDAWLHGGTQPWVWLQPLLGHPLISGAINFCYNLWFFIVYAVLILQAFDTRNKRLRMRFYLSFF